MASVPAIYFTFELGNDNEGVKTVVEPLLRTQEIAYQRAVREFMNSGYKVRHTSFNTWRTDLKINDIILVKGLRYKVTAVDIKSDSTKMVSLIKGERYE